MSSSFKLENTRRFLTVLVLAYFIFPSAVSHYLIDGSFYIYSSSQEAGNAYSLLMGIFLLVWIRLLIPNRSFRYSKLIDEIANSMAFKWSYRLFYVYMIVLIGFGIKLRMAGVSRNDLLDGMDEFLLPGMSYLLLAAAVASVVHRKNTRIIWMVVAFIVVDMIFNGKIFSFLAAGMVFFRMDYVDVSKQTRDKVWRGVFLAAPTLLLIIGLSRIVLAGGSLDLDFVAFIYALASEFLGVQASVGWAIEFFSSGHSTDLLSFSTNFFDSYVGTVGHGLALSPVAYFVGNFGEFGLFLFMAFMLCLAWIVRISRPAFSWLVYLVIALNFQHFMRHGVDVFFVKIVSQAVFLYLVMQVAGLHPLRNVEAQV